MIDIPALIASIIMGVGVITFSLGLEKAYKRRKKRKQSEEMLEIDLMDLVPLWADANKHVIEVEAEIQTKKEPMISPIQEVSAQDSSAVGDKPNETPKEPPASQEIPPSTDTVEVKPESPAQEVAPPQKPEDKPDHPFRRKVEELIKPYKNFIDSMGAREPIDFIVDMLINEGDIPSVVDKKFKETEWQTIFAGINSATSNHIYNSLKNVTLAEHSFNTLRFLLDALRAYSPQTYRGSVAGGVVAALGHDIGKIQCQKLDSKTHYNRFDHGLISAEIIDKHIDDKQPWKPTVLKAIQYHHEFAEASLSVCLQQADTAARNYEIAQVAGVSSTDAVEWLNEKNLSEVMALLVKDINTIARHSQRPDIFSFGTSVYCPVSNFIKYLRTAMWEDKGFDIRLYKSAYEDKVQKVIISRLSSVLDSPIPSAVKVATNHGNQLYPVMFVFKTMVFKINPGELEHRLLDIGMIIKSVIPLKKGAEQHV